MGNAAFDMVLRVLVEEMERERDAYLWTADPERLAYANAELHAEASRLGIVPPPSPLLVEPRR